MKVFQINTVCGTGSTGKIAVDLAGELKNNGHSSVIAFGRGEAKNWNNTYRITTPLQNKMHAVYTRITDKHALCNTKATKKLIAKIKSENPNIVHLHNLHGYYLNAKSLFEFLADYNKPVVWTLHDCWSFTGHCAYFDFVDCKKWRTGCYKCPQKKTYPKSVFLDNSKGNYKWKKSFFTAISNLTIVTPSNWLKNLVQQSFLQDYPIKVINNGIDLNVFKPTKSDFRKRYNLQNKIIVLGVANVWEKRKGIEDFIKLSKTLSNDYKIALVGTNKKQIKLLPKNILAIPSTANVKELVEIYSASDMLVNPTYEDNYPTVNLEALACGIPVITYNTGGSVESVVKDNVCLNGDIDMLKSIITRIALKEKESMDVLQFSKQYMVEKYLKLYENVL